MTPEVTGAGVTALRRAMPMVIAVQAHLLGTAGKPSGDLLAALLRIGGEEEI